MILNNADNIMLGSSEVDRVYCGSILVWERNTSPIPEGYTELNYIQSSGAQWLDPQMAAPELTDTVNVQVAFSPTSVSSADQSVVAGSHPPYGAIDRNYAIYIGYSANIYVGVAKLNGAGASGWLPNDYPPSAGTEYAIDATFDGTALSGTINGTTCTGTLTGATDLPLCLFAGGIGDSYGARGFAYCRMYYCRIYVNGSLVHNLLPCRRDADGKIGMYDTIAQAFRTNGGSGADFTGG